MPTAVTEVPSSQVLLDALRKRWTRAECAALVNPEGILERVELIDGDLIAKMSKTPPHVVALALVAAWMRRVFGEQFVLQESPINVAPEDNPSNEPEPDAIVLKRPFVEIHGGHPKPSDLRLVIEISASSLGLDLTKKATLYARAQISEYWVFDVAERRLLVHRDPGGGKYRSITAYNEQESVAPLAAADAAFLVGAAFPVNL